MWFPDKSKMGLIICAVGCVLSVSCAGYSVKDVDGNHYKVYKPVPYLVVVPTINPKTENVTIDSKIVYLPDYSHGYEIKTWNLFAKADFSFQMEDGWKLTSVSDKSDNTTIADALAGQASALIGPLMATNGNGGRLDINPYLYKIVFDGNDVYLIQVTTRGIN